MRKEEKKSGKGSDLVAGGEAGRGQEGTKNRREAWGISDLEGVQQGDKRREWVKEK